MTRLALVCALVLAACAGDDDDGATIDAGALTDAPDHADAGTDAAGQDGGACTARDLAPTWLEDYERAVVRKIAGVDAIAPGVTLVDRFTPANREAVRVYLMDELAALGYAPERHTYESGVNIVARLPANGGAGSPRLVVLGAHYDGIKNVRAAADDGTGVALVLAAARWLRDLPCRDHDVELAFFDQEESGLIGSNFYAQELLDDDEDVLAVHAFDMISYDGDGDQAIELWKPSAGLVELYEAAGARIGGSPDAIPVRVADDFASSDHQSFVDANLPVTGVSEEFVSGDHTPHYHTPQDTYENVDFVYLARVSRVAFTAVSAQIAPRAP